jgi:hypothetical protein
MHYREKRSERFLDALTSYDDAVDTNCVNILEKRAHSQKRFPTIPQSCARVLDCDDDVSVAYCTCDRFGPLDVRAGHRGRQVFSRAKRIMCQTH